MTPAGFEPATFLVIVLHEIHFISTLCDIWGSSDIGCLDSRSYVQETVAQWLRCCATNLKVAGSIPAGVSGFFIDIKSFRSHYGPGVDSASNRNEYQ